MGKMRGIIMLITSLVILNCASIVSAAELDQSYVSAFGWGSIAVSNSFPAKDHYSPSQFDYRDGKFYIARGPFDLRVLNNNGQNYKDLLDEVRSAQNAKYNNILDDNMLYVTVWLSHSPVGVKENGIWPQSSAEIPNWKPYGEMKFYLQSNFLNYNTSGYSWQDEIIDHIPGLSSWMNYAKPGYRIFVVARVGFKRSAVENKRWDPAQGRYVIPWEFIRSAPIAAATIVIK